MSRLYLQDGKAERKIPLFQMQRYYINPRSRVQRMPGKYEINYKISVKIGLTMHNVCETVIFRILQYICQLSMTKYPLTGQSTRLDVFSVFPHNIRLSSRNFEHRPFSKTKLISAFSLYMT